MIKRKIVIIIITHESVQARTAAATCSRAKEGAAASLLTARTAKRAAVGSAASKSAPIVAPCENPTGGGN